MKIKLQVVAGIMLLAMLFHGAAQAADFEVQPADSDGQVTIIMTGDIEEGDDAKFKAIAAKYSDAIVFLHSDGGATLAGLEIGRTIRAKKYTTAVVDGADCASACALIWLAGTPKAMTPHAKIGFHASYTDENGQLLESGVANALVGRYLTLLDLPEEAVIFTTLAAPQELNWLTPENFKEAGIDAKVIDIDAAQQDEIASTPAPAPKPEPASPKREAATSDEEGGSGSDDVEWRGKVGNWSIGVDKTLGDSCFMLASYKGGTEFRIGFDASDELTSYFLFGNDDWTYLKADKKYELEFTLGDNSPWSVSALAVDAGDGVTLLTGYFTESEFWDEFSSSESLLISREGKTMTGLALQDSGKAYEALIACQDEQHPQTKSGRKIFGTPVKD